MVYLAAQQQQKKNEQAKCLPQRFFNFAFNHWLIRKQKENLALASEFLNGARLFFLK